MLRLIIIFLFRSFEFQFSFSFFYRHRCHGRRIVYRASCILLLTKSIKHSKKIKETNKFTYIFSMYVFDFVAHAAKKKTKREGKTN